jgi:hypothetical protein
MTFQKGAGGDKEDRSPDGPGLLLLPDSNIYLSVHASLGICRFGACTGSIALLGPALRLSLSELTALREDRYTMHENGAELTT